MANLQLNTVHYSRLLALLVFFVVSYHFFQRSPNSDLGETGNFSKRDGVKNHTSIIRDTYDYIIIGGGQSDLTVANRLSEGKATVLVVEYGYLYRDIPLIARPWQPFDRSRE